MSGSPVEIVVLIVAILAGFAAGYFWKSRTMKEPKTGTK